MDRDFVIDVLAQAVGRRHSTEHRIESAVQARQAVLQALNRGEEVVSPRYQWVHRQSLRVLEMLSSAAKAFDGENGTDKATSLDLLDILQVAHNKLEAIVKQGAMDPSSFRFRKPEDAVPEAEEQDEDDEG